MIVSAIMGLIIIATPAHDTLIRIALYSLVACALLDPQPVGVVRQPLHYMIGHILACKHALVLVDAPEVIIAHCPLSLDVS